LANGEVSKTKLGESKGATDLIIATKQQLETYLSNSEYWGKRT